MYFPREEPAHWEFLLQPVAIKMMFRTDQKAQDDFLKEIKLLKQLSRDANIVQYFGASLQEDQLWLVTEYMEVRYLLAAKKEPFICFNSCLCQYTVDLRYKQTFGETSKGLLISNSRFYWKNMISAFKVQTGPENLCL